MANQPPHTKPASLYQSVPVMPYILLAYGLSWLVMIPLLLSVKGIIAIQLPHELEMLAAFGPLLAAIIIIKKYAGQAGIKQLKLGLSKWRVGTTWQVFSIFSPFFLLLAGVVIIRITQGEFPDFGSDSVLQLLTLAGLFKLIIVTAVVQSLGEEPGWRGLAIPVLRTRFSPLIASLALFPFWLCWHLPQFLSRPEFGTAQFIGFSVGILSATMWLTLIWDKTQSILMAVLWHTCINIARNIALAVSPSLFMTMNTLVLIGAVLIVAYWILGKHDKHE